MAARHPATRMWVCVCDGGTIAAKGTIAETRPAQRRLRVYVSPFDLPKKVGILSTMPGVEGGASRGRTIDGSDWGYLPHARPRSATDQRCGQWAGSRAGYMHGDKDVADKVLARPWCEASVARWHHAFHFAAPPRLATLLPGCRDAFLVLGAQSPKSGRLVNDLRCAGSDSHNWQLSPQIFSWFAWEGMGEFVIDRARSAVLNGPHVRPALRLRVVGANSPELISRIPCSQCYR